MWIIQKSDHQSVAIQIRKIQSSILFNLLIFKVMAIKKNQCIQNEENKKQKMFQNYAFRWICLVFLSFYKKK